MRRGATLRGSRGKGGGRFYLNVTGNTTVCCSKRQGNVCLAFNSAFCVSRLSVPSGAALCSPDCTLRGELVSTFVKAQACTCESC